MDRPVIPARRAAGIIGRLAAAGAAAVVLMALAVAVAGPAPRPQGDAPVVLSASSFAAVVGDVSPAARVLPGASDRLALQLRAGAPADLIVTADPSVAAALHAEGLVSAPVPVARTRLVLAVSAGARGRVRTIADLAAPGVRVAWAADAVPLGRYARVALARAGLARAVAANAVSEDPDAAAVIAKVAGGDADAALAYRADAAAAGARIVALPVPAALQPAISYVAAVPLSAPRPAAGAALVAALRAPAGRAALHRHGLAAAP